MPDKIYNIQLKFNSRSIESVFFSINSPQNTKDRAAVYLKFELGVLLSPSQSGISSLWYTHNTFYHTAFIFPTAGYHSLLSF